MLPRRNDDDKGSISNTENETQLENLTISQVRPPRELALHLLLRRVAASPALLHCSGCERW
jgi:hypothetical protein